MPNNTLIIKIRNKKTERKKNKENSEAKNNDLELKRILHNRLVTTKS